MVFLMMVTFMMILGGISYYIEEDAYKKEALEAAYNEIMDLHKVECADDQTYPICYNGYSSNGTEFCEAQSLDSGDTAECSSYQDLGSDYYVGSASDQLVSEVVGNNVGLLCLADMPYEEPSYAPDPPDDVFVDVGDGFLSSCYSDEGAGETD